MKPIGNIVRIAVRKPRNQSNTRDTFSVQINAGNRSRFHEERAHEARMMKESGAMEQQKETQDERSKTRV